MSLHSSRRQDENLRGRDMGIAQLGWFQKCGTHQALAIGVEGKLYEVVEMGEMVDVACVNR